MDDEQLAGWAALRV